MITPERPQGAAFAAIGAKARQTNSLTRDLPLALLLEPLDPMRHDMNDESLLELQNDIREHGLYENLCVVPVMPGQTSEWERVQIQDIDAHIRSGGRFRVAAGHRRLLACRAVLYDPVRCEVFYDSQVTEEAIMHGENMHREDPSDFDLAVMYSKWLQEPGITEKEVQRRAGKSMTFIYDRVELLNGYKEVADALHARKINCSVAKAINRCDEPEYAMHFLNMAIDGGSSAKLVNAWVNERKAFKDMQGPQGPVPPPRVAPATQVFQKIECLLCGDIQSYNLQVVTMCGACKERVRVAREDAEAAESKTPQ